MLVIFMKPKSYGISGQIFGLISSFVSNRRLRVVLDGKFSLMTYTLITFLMILLVILLSMLRILLSIRNLICGNNLNWLLNLNLIYETLWTGARSGLLITMPGKLNWFLLTGLIKGFY